VDWAISWAMFSQTHPVTLSLQQQQKKENFSRRKSLFRFFSAAATKKVFLPLSSESGQKEIGLNKSSHSIRAKVIIRRSVSSNIHLYKFFSRSNDSVILPSIFSTYFPVRKAKQLGEYISSEN
jgi:hypothetical protein